MDTTWDTNLNPGPSEGENLRTQVYSALKRKLLHGDFPLGRRLAEGALAEQFGVSRTPIRGALSRLYAEGLVTRIPEGGFTPAAPDLHSISELYEIRRSLEFCALQRGNHDSDRLEALREEWSGMRAPSSDDECGPDFVVEDENFHVQLATASGNRSLVDMLIGVNERIRVVRMHDFLTADRVLQTIEEHLAIVESLLAGDSARTELALSSHLEISESVVEQRAAQALSRMIARQI